MSRFNIGLVAASLNVPRQELPVHYRRFYSQASAVLDGLDALRRAVRDIPDDELQLNLGLADSAIRASMDQLGWAQRQSDLLEEGSHAPSYRRRQAE